MYDVSQKGLLCNSVLFCYSSIDFDNFLDIEWWDFCKHWIRVHLWRIVHNRENEMRLLTAAVALFGNGYDMIAISWDRVGYSECSEWCSLVFTIYCFINCHV